MQFDATFFALVALVIFLAIAAYAGAFKKMAAGLDTRAERIRKELEHATQLRKDAEALLVEYKQKRLDAENGEIKSMRVDDAFLGKGVGRALLDHVLAAAKAGGLKTVWLETGSAPAFLPALQLYESAGFVRCGPFADYKPDPFSIFMTRAT